MMRYDGGIERFISMVETKFSQNILSGHKLPEQYVILFNLCKQINIYIYTLAHVHKKNLIVNTSGELKWEQ